MPTVSVDRLTINYEARGERGPAVCLVHGSGGHTGAWRPQIDGLADVARVVALDLPGHGRSSGSFATIDDAVRVVIGFVAALRLSPVVIGGHSMGGAIAQAFALGAPRHTAGVMLIGTGARLRVLPKIIETIERDHAAGAQLVTDLAVGASASPALRNAVYDDAMRVPARTLAGDFRACDSFDVMARVSQIRAPTLIVTGADDPLTPPKYGRFLGDRIAGAEVIVVPGAGHYVQLERPDEVTRAMRAFLARLG